MNRGLSGLIAPPTPDNLAALMIKGDLYVVTGPGQLARLPVGSNDQYLQASSVAANGVQWVTVKRWKGVWNSPPPTTIYDLANVQTTQGGGTGWIVPSPQAAFPFYSFDFGGGQQGIPSDIQSQNVSTTPSAGAPPDARCVGMYSGAGGYGCRFEGIVPAGITKLTYYAVAIDGGTQAFFLNGSQTHTWPNDSTWHPYSVAVSAGQLLSWRSQSWHAASWQSYVAHIAYYQAAVYNAGDLVYYNGVFYTSTVDANVATPGASATWTPLLAKTSGLRTITRALFR